VRNVEAVVFLGKNVQYYFDDCDFNNADAAFVLASSFSYHSYYFDMVCGLCGRLAGEVDTI